MPMPHMIQKNKRSLIAIWAGVIVVAILFAFVGGVFEASDPKEQTAKTIKLKTELVTQITALGYVQQPINMPVGYKRVKVEIIPLSKTATGCEEVLQRFSNTTDTDNSFIDIYSSVLSCEFPRPDDAQVFNVSDYAGWKSDTNKNISVLLEIVVNANRIRVESSLEISQMTSSLGAFVPFSEKAPKDSLKIS